MEAVTRCVEDLRELLAESELTESRAFVRSFVREVRVIRNEVLLTYTMPFPPEKISEERTGVLYSVHPWWAIRNSSRTFLREKAAYSGFAAFTLVSSGVSMT